MQFSKYQTAFFDEIANGDGSIALEAVAGSGKTFSIVEAAKRIPADQRVLVIAFNKHIADELKRKCPQHVAVSTFHALGYGVWRRFCGGNVLVKEQKTFDILDELLPPRWEGNRKILSPLRKAIGPFVKRLVGLAKDEGVGVLLPDEPATYHALIERHDLYIDVPLARVEAASYDELEDQAIAYTQQVIQKSREIGEKVIDFSDMLWLPLVEGITTFFKNDYVFIDEAQDVSATQRAILSLTLKKTGRLIAVGDRNQAIYGWRGASIGSIDQIVAEFGCKQLPLSISYRCAKRIIREAQQYVPHIEAHEAAPEGVVETREKYTAEDFGPHDAVLCRTTAPLIEFAYWLIHSGRGCKVLGREIGAGLAVLIKRMKAKDIGELRESLRIWRERETNKALENDDEAKAQRIGDQVDCVFSLISNLPAQDHTIEGLLQSIDTLFSDTNGVTVCSTIHKAKGAEWERVFWLEYDRPTPWARQEWSQKEELCLRYVATTRAKKHLTYIKLDGRC